MSEKEAKELLDIARENLYLLRYLVALNERHLINITNYALMLPHNRTLH